MKADNQSIQIIRSDDLRAENRHRILRVLRNEGSLPRARISQLTGLSQASISNLLRHMTSQGIVSSANDKEPAGKRGRPQTTVSLCSEAAIAITVSLTVDTLSIHAIDYTGKQLLKIDRPTDGKEYDSHYMEHILVPDIERVIDRFSDLQLKAISVAFQGVTDSQSGDLVWSPIMSAGRVPLRRILAEHFHVPVSVNNDCGLIAASLHRSNKESLTDNFVTLLFSYGVGMAVYLSGKPFTGPLSSGFELGHIQFVKNDGALCRCGKNGCIEAYASDYGIKRMASGASSSQNPEGKISDEEFSKLIAAALDNEPQATEAFSMAGKAVGTGLAIVFTLLDPIPVALVGHNAEASKLISSEIDAALQSVSRCPSDCLQLLHSFPDESALLIDGLAMEATASMDRDFADLST